MSKQWISAQMDTELVRSLSRHAEAAGITRSEAMRQAIEAMVGPQKLSEKVPEKG